MSKYGNVPVDLKLVINSLFRKQKNLPLKGRLDTCSLRGGQAIIAPISALDPVALRPRLSAGLPLAL